MKGPFTKHLTNALLHPASLALPFALLICFLLPDIYQKYTIKPISEAILERDRIKEYLDLDYDGNSEIIHYGTFHGSAYLSISNQFGMIDQWNVRGKYAFDGKRYAAGDYNKDGIKEVFTVTYRNDSLFVQGIDFRKKGTLFLPERFLIGIPDSDTKPFATSSFQLADLTGDGAEELVLIVNAGFGLMPRRVVAYDILHDQVFISAELGAFCKDLQIADLDADGRPELCLSNYGSANY